MQRFRIRVFQQIFIYICFDPDELTAKIVFTDSNPRPLGREYPALTTSFLSKEGLFTINICFIIF